MTSKSDAPALRLVVERGPKLVPASAFDAERLDTFKPGRVLRFTPIEEADRKDIRRWWAILNRAVKDTKTPWRTATQASEAIKLALGIVEYGKTVGGQFMQWPKSLKELDDEELAEAVRDMAALLHKMTGVDPLEWNRESADVGRDEIEQPETSSPDDTGSGSSGEETPPAQDSAAADQSAGAADPSPEEEDASQVSTSGDDNYRRLLKLECVDSFIGIATRGDTSIEAKRKQMADTLRAWRNEPVPPDFIEKCRDAAGRIVKKESTVEREREYLGRFTQ